MIFVNLSAVKKPHTEIEIPCKGSPEDVGKLQICRNGNDLFVIYGGENYQNEHHYKPYKSKKICPEIEENKAPHKIEEQTYSINEKPLVGSILVLTPVEPYKGRAYTHKHVKHRPYHGKKK